MSRPRDMGCIDEVQIASVPHKRISKAEFVSLIDGQLEKCMDNEAALGALTIVYSFVELRFKAACGVTWRRPRCVPFAVWAPERPTTTSMTSARSAFDFSNT